jgi:hypothetical protein
MTNSAQYQAALGRLREVLVDFKSGHPVYDAIVPWRGPVLAHFQPIFTVSHLDALTADEFKAFLQDSNNHHWSGLNRKGGRACDDMPKLRAMFKILLDETQPIDERYDQVVSQVAGMGKALATAILLVAYPDRYGVWNNTSENTLKSLEIWPKYDQTNTPGRRYAKVNQVLNDLAHDLEIDLWTLDALWWSVQAGTDLPRGWTSEAEISVEREVVPELTPLVSQSFKLEKYLQEFLRDNWDHTELGREWEIYSEDNEEVGIEYDTSTVGRIDVLARHKREPRWLVMELKRNQTSDATVGQVLRYMGWVKQNLAKLDEQIEGLVVAHEVDENIKYAISASPHVRLMLYEVEFRLSYAPEVGSQPR